VTVGGSRPEPSLDPDIDFTIKPLCGHQQVAQIGHNLANFGTSQPRPSQLLHGQHTALHWGEGEGAAHPPGSGRFWVRCRAPTEPPSCVHPAAMAKRNSCANASRGDFPIF
jgi:hypothetical protein